jgi:hypothetical protein
MQKLFNRMIDITRSSKFLLSISPCIAARDLNARRKLAEDMIAHDSCRRSLRGMVGPVNFGKSSIFFGVRGLEELFPLSSRDKASISEED